MARIIKNDYLWPSRDIAFEIDSEFSDEAKNIILNAVKVLNSKTNINLIPITNENDCLFFKNHTNSSSVVGYRKKALAISYKHKIHLDEDADVNTVVHEILHSLGLFHEQTRRDRDNFISIKFGHILRGSEHNFKISKDGIDFGNYDYSSIMHYGTEAKAIKWTIDKSLFGLRDGNIKEINSKASPALTVLNNVLHMVHIGESTNRIWHSQFDGNLWSEKPIPNQTSKASPAITVLNNELHMVHLGESSNRIFHSRFNGTNWSENLIPNQTSKASPALVVLNNELHMVHLGESSNRIFHSRFNGTNWSEVLIPNQTSKASPALAVFNNQLHMVHLGNSTSKIYHSVFDGTNWSEVLIPNQTSKAPPALVVFNNQLHMVHIGNTTNKLWHSYFSGNKWSKNKVDSNQLSKTSPYLIEFDNKLFMYHLGDKSDRIWFSYYNNNLKTIELPINENTQPGQSNGISNNDITAINFLYPI